ncbi:type II toxin-antitoxin system RelE/ParE family toxin [Novosphingobium cyanobacteriorum]|uniref:Type II toxin-antitoxin system RelE/ParE family toxin n=1 Tax=Novosphingobium cyanobacteriorum TaxID=3024215 RepID=A0ABT6CG86_9SPHN|nr:type II toxin-antitoxin system RelE/ParE family toxin [Novosphingobium cyanobacteriorum]MDF8332938.1 type II toxin-antitoxin system RelE/ParE family toxin [Novosphingobium cyanobacteriorum]
MISQGAERDLMGLYRRRRAQRGLDGPDGAEALLTGLVAAAGSLADFALRGSTPPELEALGIHLYRQIPARIGSAAFRLVYLPEAERVTILIVADSRRDFRTLLEERLLRR